MDYSSILKDTSFGRDYRVEEFLSKGSYGEVYKVRRTLDDRLFALKVFRKSKSSTPKESTSQKMFRQEADILRGIKSTYIVGFEGFFESSNSIFILMEYCAGGDLLQYIKNVKEATGQGISESDSIMVVTAMLRALKTLHQEHKVVHRDIKPANILIRRSLKQGQHASLKLEDICLADFGLSIIFNSPLISKASRRCGTDSFNSPEQLLGEPYDMVNTRFILVCRCFRFSADSVHFAPGKAPIQEWSFLV